MVLLIVLIIFQVVIFVFLVFLLRRVLSKNITSATQHLDTLTKDYMEKEAEVDKRLDEIKKMYEKKITEAKEEAEKIKQSIQREAVAEKEKIIEKAHRESEEMLEQAERARQALILDMDKKIREKAIEEASRLLKESLPDEVRFIIHNYLVDEFIKSGIEQLHISSELGNIQEATIKSAFPLKDDIFYAIVSKLKEKTGEGIKFLKEEDSALVSGLLIKVGSMVIDGSLRWLINKKAQQLINKGE